ncbi:MAG: ribonuclease Y [Phycisphaerae bacterium]|nr:ribonuclease Y [Phycisphaerae bacterium]MBM91516.1 ribonuclease Y [Phycisphaerae bacterium]MBM92614.1 ribonuclease Y [Phycisphaerae bacterium]
MPALTQGGAAGNSHVTLTVLIGFIALIAGLGLGYVLAGFIGSKKLEGLKAEAEVIASRAKEDAKNAADKILIEADRNALARKEAVDKELEAARNEQREFERRLAKREDILDRKEETLSHKESNLSEQSERVEAERERLRAREAELTDLKDKQQRELERVAQLDRTQAKEQLLERVAEQTRSEMGRVTREIIEEAEEGAKDEAKEILINAIQRYANEHSSETTVRTVAIPSDDMKGRIIGREGRNIRAIEKATGADIIVDDTPGVIVVSCFDKVRQAIAVESLERLIADGRMHPTRIEEVVEKVTGEVGEKIIKAGKDAAVELGLKGLHPKIIEAMGRLTYRTSYGQNVLKHSMEVAYLCQIIADQLGLDGKLAKRCGFLHDIGKAMDHEMEGGHPKIGMDFARQYGEKEEAVLNAIGAHHADMPSTTWYTPIVMAADAVSAARPGARRESMERYIQRLNDLQDIALAIPGVSEAYAVQAGREVRVMIDADRISDDESYLIAHEIAKRVSNEMTFPGEIRVTVLRETRAIEIAR